MNSIDVIRKLKNLKEAVLIFRRTATKYPFSHNYYKNNLKDLRFKIRGFLLKTQKIKKGGVEDICNLFSIFLSVEKPSPKECDGLINELDLKIQSMEINFEEDLSERIYDQKSRFDFRIDIKEIFDKANKEIFIIDSWINEDLLEIYLKNIKRKIKIRVLSGENPKGKIVKLINDFNNQYNSLQIRESSKIHDRGVFTDNCEGWVMGQSIKDAAKEKPTYLIKLQNPKQLETIYKKIWNLSKKVK